MRNTGAWPTNAREEYRPLGDRHAFVTNQHATYHSSALGKRLLFKLAGCEPTYGELGIRRKTSDYTAFQFLLMRACLHSRFLDVTLAHKHT